MNTPVTVAVMNQFSARSGQGEDNALRAGLAHAGLPHVDDSIAAGATTANTVSLVEQSVTGLLLLRAADTAHALSEVLQSQCGIGLSDRLFSNTNGAYCVRWMSPDCWLLSCPLDEAFAIESAIRAAVNGHVAIVNVSGGYNILELSGRDARNVLMKSTGYDTHPDHLTPGKVVNTSFAKTQVTLRAVESNDAHSRFELIVRRSFSDYIWLWLQRASAEYGLMASHQ